MAILREKRLKEWERKWKIELIEKSNPKWIDLFEASFFKMPGPRLSSG
jgi:putative endonuclease